MKRIYTRSLTPSEGQVQSDNVSAFRGSIAATIDQLISLFDEKGHKQNVLEPIWHRMPHGDASWSTMVEMKASRACAGVQNNDPEFLEEELGDLIVYALCWAAWRKLMSCRHTTRMTRIEDEVTDDECCSDCSD